MIEVAHMSVLVAKPMMESGRGIACRFQPELKDGEQLLENMERIRSRYDIQRTFVDQTTAPETGIEVVHGRLALIDVIAPHRLGNDFHDRCFVQTDTGRNIAGTMDQSFDVDVPGTLRSCTLG